MSDVSDPEDEIVDSTPTKSIPLATTGQCHKLHVYLALKSMIIFYWKQISALFIKKYFENLIVALHI